MPQTGTAGGDEATKDARRWARRITLVLIVAPSTLAFPHFLNAVAHARADSEVGVMMYGFPLFIGAMLGSPMVGALALAWGLGMAKARRRGEAIPRWEMGAFGIVATLITLLLLAFSGNFLRMLVHR